MKIKLYISYFAAENEHLCVSTFKADKESLTDSFPMSQISNGVWYIEIEHTANFPFRYSYVLKYDNKVIRKECDRARSIISIGSEDVVTSFDKWRNIPQKPYAYTAPFRVIFGRMFGETQRKEGHLSLYVEAPELPRNLSLAVTGNFIQNNPWSVKHAIELKFGSDFIWGVSIPIEELSCKTLEYKYILIDNQTKKFVAWEDGDNRILSLSDIKSNESVRSTGDILRYKFDKWRSAGFVIPLFSLRSANSWGVGDITDLKNITLWAEKANLRIIQLLPINDTTNEHNWQDSYPYSAISSFAIHPIYLDVIEVGKLKDKKRFEYYKKIAAQLNSSQTLDYQKVSILKADYLKELYTESGYNDLTTSEALCFIEKNKDWLFAYAAYSNLRDTYGTADFTKWGDFSKYDRDKIAEYTATTSKAYSDIAYYIFLQYHLYKQLTQARSMAHSLGIVFKGDIPIGVNRNSVDVWQHPEIFDCSLQAGAPPDAFARDGQNWGFPTYKWDEMERDGYTWWRDRLSIMSQYLDAYRIDHILGFFRIWSIPVDSKSGLLGHFVPSLPLSVSDIEAAGLKFDKDKYAQPYIEDKHLYSYFGEYAQQVKERCFVRVGESGLSVKKDFSTTAKVDKKIKYIADKGVVIRKGMHSILKSVLFIEDKQKRGYYHPRIEGYDTEVYKTLSLEQQRAFDNIHNDYYYRRHNTLWKQEALKRLPALITATDMLVCGEDLGMIPSTVPEVMNLLNILSLEVERMPKTEGIEIADVNSYPYLSVCTTSTHDMPTLRCWWEESHEKASYYYSNVLSHTDAPPKSATPELCREILVRNLNASSMLAIIPLQDILSVNGALRRRDIAEERINDPSDSDNKWCYRMHINIEELLSNFEFTSDIAKMVKDSKRG